MTKRVVEHEIKLQKSVKIILGVLLNAFAPVFDVRDAFAELGYGDTINMSLSGIIGCDFGCN